MTFLLWLSLVAAPAAAAPVSELRVLTYNVYGVVPWGEGGTLSEAEVLTHYRTIGDEFARLRAAGQAPHVVVLQEMFHPLADVVISAAGYPYKAMGPGAKLPRRPFRSGLVILSEFPLEDAQAEAYPECTGWDCFANKGQVTARVLVPGLPEGLQVYTTHMNADDSGASLPESKAARLAQARRLAPFITRTRRPGAPAVFAGDFNFRPGDEDYGVMAAVPGFMNAVEKLDSGFWRTAIDHQFFSPGNSPGFLPVRFEQTFTDVGGKAPSDHLGVQVRYRLGF